MASQVFGSFLESRSFRLDAENKPHAAPAPPPQVMLFDSLTLVANPRRLLNDPSFKAFVSPIVDERGTFGEGQDLEAVIMEVCRSKM